jgi:hypothetical protein
MGSESWQAFYKGDLQGVYSLLVVPALFLVFWAVRGHWRARPDEGRDSRFLRVYLLLFAVETLIDPLATGPLLRHLDLGGGFATAVGLLFVLLGDFRVFWLVFALSESERGPGAAGLRALAFTPIVAVSAFALQSALGAAFGELPAQVLWLSHEVLFVGMALYLRNVVVTRAHGQTLARVRGLRRAAGYVALYYGLWATSDVLILFGVDLGWLLRAVPNQLYYAFWIPWVYGVLGRDEG